MSARSSSHALHPVAGPLRAARSVAVAAICTVTAALGHVVGGGEVPPTALLTLVAGASTIAWLLSARRVTPAQLVGLLVLCQTGVHAGCSTGEMTMSAVMIAGHVGATIVSAILLARGEAFVWHLAERLGLRAATRTLRSAVVPHWRPLSPVVATRSLHDVRLAHSRAERGPPSGS